MGFKTTSQAGAPVQCRPGLQGHAAGCAEAMMRLQPPESGLSPAPPLHTRLQLTPIETSHFLKGQHRASAVRNCMITGSCILVSLPSFPSLHAPEELHHARSLGYFKRWMLHRLNDNGTVKF